MTDMMWHAQDLLKATGGRAINGDTWSATGFAMDSRVVKNGDLFIALKGDAGTERYRSSGNDGHDYVQAAYDNGAVAAIVDHELHCDIPQIIVTDTFQALQDLGRYARGRTSLQTAIGITGSVGKTGTRDMIKTAFDGAEATTHASIKSYNNIIGVPYTLATMPLKTEVGVFEAGMNFAGEITPLSHLIRPTMAVITWIAAVHIENFDDGIAGIVKAKSEIFKGVEEGGCAILPHDNDYYDDLVVNARQAGIERIYSFGEHPEADARLVACDLSANGTTIKANIMGEEVDYTLHIAGKHIAVNSMIALLAVKLAGRDVKPAAQALSAIAPPEGRGTRETIALTNGSVTLIDESYNASPVAVKAALKVLSIIDPKGQGRRIAVLGDMLELGDYARDMHAGLAQPLQAASVDRLYCCGPHMKVLYDAIPDAMKGGYAASSSDLVTMVQTDMIPGDVILVKGSLGSKMKVIIEALKNPE